MMAVLLPILSLICAVFSSADVKDVGAVASETLGVYYYGNQSAPFEYFKATITIPSKPLPALEGQFLYYYVGLVKKQLAATGIVVFCGTKGGCWNGAIPSGYSFYSELSYGQGHGNYAGGEKIAIEAGQSVDVTIIQSGTYLSVNMTRPNGDGKDSYFDIYGANDGGLFDIIAGVDLQYDSNQKEICDDYNKEPFGIADIVAVEVSGVSVEDIDFKQDPNDNNSCRGSIEVGPKGKSLKIIGAKE